VEVPALNNVKTAFWMVLLTVILVFVGRIVAGDIGMLATFGLAVILNATSYWFSDRIALGMARAREVSQAEAPRLHAIADELALRYGVPKPRVYLSPDPTPNAFATGRNPKHAAIVVNQGLLGLLNDRELTGVLAHELGHVHNRDILISSVVAVLAGAITMIANLAQWSLWFGGSNRYERGSSPFGPIAILLTALLAPLAAMLVQLAVSRSREYEADATGARVSGDPHALASALSKLEQVDRRAPSPLAQPAFAHLYIVNPLSAGGLSSLFSTHPPIEERVRRLEAMAATGQLRA
jgi:heat shock protein HtpX